MLLPQILTTDGIRGPRFRPTRPSSFVPTCAGKRPEGPPETGWISGWRRKTSLLTVPSLDAERCEAWALSDCLCSLLRELQISDFHAGGDIGRCDRQDG